MSNTNSKMNYFKKYPWAQSYNNSYQRCNNKNDKSYKYYGGKGIKMLMSIKDFEFIWNRDKANLLEHPSIDRIDSDGNYEISNCRFIERSLNAFQGRWGKLNRPQSSSSKYLGSTCYVGDKAYLRHRYNGRNPCLRCGNIKWSQKLNKKG